MPSALGTHEADDQKLTRLLSEIAQQIRHSENARRDTLQELQAVAIDLAVAATAQVLRRQITASEFDIGPIVTEMTSAGLGRPLQIYLHPKDLQRVKVQFEKSGSDELLLTADPKLPEGSCRAIGPTGGLVYDITSHLAEMRRHLFEGLNDAELAS